jgi:hypothetical protein
MNNVKNELLVIFNNVKSNLTTQQLVRYLVEGIAVAIAAYVIPNRRTKLNEVAVIAFIAAISLFILDVFSKDIGVGSRLGAGFGIGYNLVNSAATSLPFLV